MRGDSEGNKFNGKIYMSKTCKERGCIVRGKHREGNIKRMRKYERKALMEEKLETASTYEKFLWGGCFEGRQYEWRHVRGRVMRANVIRRGIMKEDLEGKYHEGNTIGNVMRGDIKRCHLVRERDT